MLMAATLCYGSDESSNSLAGYLGAGVAVVKFNTSVSVSKNSSPLDYNIDLEDTLGLDSSNHVDTFFGGMAFGERHKIALNYFSINRKNDFIAEEITYQGQNLGNVRGSARDHTRFLDFNYGYNLLNNERNRITAEIGLFSLDMDMGLSVVGELEAINRYQSVSYSDDFDVLVPLPLIGFDFENQLSENWSLSTKVAMIYGEYDGVTAGILRTHIRANYKVSRNFNLSTGLNYFDADIDINKSAEKQGVDYGYIGVYAGLSYGF